MVTVRGWGRKEPTDAALAREFAAAVRDLETWSRFRMLASVGGEPAACGGCTLRAEVATCGARSPCGSTGGAAPTGRCRPTLRLARVDGATLALVKGRAGTSGPILSGPDSLV